MATTKDFDTIKANAVKQGWRIVENKGHLKWYAPDGVGLVTSGTSESDYRGIKNHLSRLRRFGYKG